MVKYLLTNRLSVSCQEEWSLLCKIKKKSLTKSSLLEIKRSGIFHFKQRLYKGLIKYIVHTRSLHPRLWLRNGRRRSPAARQTAPYSGTQQEKPWRQKRRWRTRPCSPWSPSPSVLFWRRAAATWSPCCASWPSCTPSSPSSVSSDTTVSRCDSFWSIHS